MMHGPIDAARLAAAERAAVRAEAARRRIDVVTHAILASASCCSPCRSGSC